MYTRSSTNKFFAALALGATTLLPPLTGGGPPTRCSCGPADKAHKAPDFLGVVDFDKGSAHLRQGGEDRAAAELAADGDPALHGRYRQ